MPAPALPLTIALKPALIRELLACEEGAHEDSQAAIERGEEPDRVVLAYVVCERAIADGAAALEVRTPAEASDLYYAICAGTFQDYHLPTARRIADALRELAIADDPEMVRLWAAPYGGWPNGR